MYMYTNMKLNQRFDAPFALAFCKSHMSLAKLGIDLR